MKKLSLLFICVLMFCIQIQCNDTAPLGRPIISVSDGRFDKDEVAALEKYVEDGLKNVSKEDLYKLLISYANDMRTIIKICVWPEWSGIDKVYLNVVGTQEELVEAWFNGSKDNSDPPRAIVGFYTYSLKNIHVMKQNNLVVFLGIYNHEEGHHLNYISGEATEFPAEYNERWKAFLMLAINPYLGIDLTDTVSRFGPEGLYKDNNTIKKMGRYRAASLMFFFVANHFDGDLTEGAKFVFGNKGKVLKKFFYSKLNMYKDRGLTMGEIWEKENLTLWNSIGLQKYIQSIRESIQQAGLN